MTLGEIERRGWTLKGWTRQSGAVRSGGLFTENSLRRLLTNALYTGNVRHKGQVFPGEHPPIIDSCVWKRVQLLVKQRPDSAFVRNKHQALLSGLLVCEPCESRMIYVWAGKKERRYPYYVCLRAHRSGWSTCPSKSLPAQALEETVLSRIRERSSPLLDWVEWEAADRTRQIAMLDAVVERVSFDGARQQISIRFHADREASQI